MRFKKIIIFVVVGILVLMALGAIGKNKKGVEEPAAPDSATQPIKEDTVELRETAKPTAAKTKTSEFIIGIEYAVEGQDAAAFGKLGIGAMKPLPQSINWSKMQPDLAGPVDYRILDAFVKEYQNAGFRDLVLALRTLSHAEDNKATYGKDRPVPKPEHENAYTAWVKGVVERYDKDGTDDMPGLKYPVRYYEIEGEFSSYTPEPVDDYLKKLKIAYQAAHDAYPAALVAHSAFLVATAFDSDPSPGEYEKAFAAMRIPDKHHNLADMRKVLDHPELFDRVNFHELGDPVMIERTVGWLQYETGKRGYEKHIIISDTSPTPFAGYGRATSCTGPALAVISFPAKDSDRCRLAEYFNKILDGDAKTVAWKNWYLAGDLVKKVVVAAASGVELINTAFTGDLPILNTKLGFAGAGNGGFGGVVSQEYNFLAKKFVVTEYRPGFYALRELAGKLKDLKSIARESSGEDVRLYRIETSKSTFWIGWLHPDYLVLPGDAEPSTTVSLPSESRVTVAEMAVSEGASKTISAAPKDGAVNVTFTMTPVYIMGD